MPDHVESRSAVLARTLRNGKSPYCRKYRLRKAIRPLSTHSIAWDTKAAERHRIWHYRKIHNPTAPLLEGCQAKDSRPCRRQETSGVSNPPAQHITTIGRNPSLCRGG